MRPFLVLPFVVSLALAPRVGLANTPAAKDLSEIKNKIEEHRRLLFETEIKKRGILGALYEITRNLRIVETDIQNIQAQLKESERVIKDYAQTIVRMETITKEQKKKLMMRLRALYKMGSRGYAEVLFASQSTGELSRNIKFLKIVSQKDMELITNYRTNVKELAAQQVKFKEQVRKYAEVEKSLKAQQRKFAEEKAKHSRFLAQVDSDRDLQMKLLAESREAGEKLEAQLRSLGLEGGAGFDFRSKAFFEVRGRLSPPVHSPLLQKYGIYKNKNFDTKLFHKGLFFGSRTGDAIHSIYDGKVAFAGWVDGYGQTIIVDHGDHYFSLYAHCEQIKKHTGDSVRAGEDIASTGDTGSLRGPGLYLEIRHFSESLDPSTWLDLASLRRI